MKIRRPLTVFSMALALLGGAAASVICTSCGGGAKAPTLTSSPMPEGEVWTGVYFNQVYGMAHILEHDGKIWGRYKWQNQSHWGEISGTVDGNVAHFTWTEYVVGPVAPGQEKTGHGYWVYALNADKIGSLTGQFGYGEDEVGQGNWNALKQKNIPANPDSIKADVASDVPATGDSWDKGGNGGATDPTAPAPTTPAPAPTDAPAPDPAQ